MADKSARTLVGQGADESGGHDQSRGFGGAVERRDAGHAAARRACLAARHGGRAAKSNLNVRL